MTVYQITTEGVTPIPVTAGRQVLTAAAAANKIGAVLVGPSGHLINHQQRRKAS